jgi:hypothetical protein
MGIFQIEYAKGAIWLVKFAKQSGTIAKNAIPYFFCTKALANLTVNILSSETFKIEPVMIVAKEMNTRLKIEFAINALQIALAARYYQPTAQVVILNIFSLKKTHVFPHVLILCGETRQL